MIRVTTFAGQDVAVFGLGSSGSATCRALIAGGARVAASDDGEAACAKAREAGLPVTDLRGADWRRFAALVLAPGIPLTHPEPHWTVMLAKAAGVPVLGDIELLFRERAAHCPDAPLVAVTGTNGKSTTTALIAHILRQAGLDVAMGGNIGVDALSLAPLDRQRIHVLEMSSFQIDLTPSLAPTVGVLVNLTPDHLDRHGPADDAAGAMQNYAAIKERLVAASGAAVIGIDDDHCRAIAGRLAAAGRRVTRIATGAPADVRHADGRLVDATGRVLLSLEGISTLRGAHNGQNAAASLAAVRLVGVADEVAAAAMATYPGLPHRMEEVGRLAKPGGHVVFINDSKATNADSTGKALASWPGEIYWILGGKPKEGGITTLSAYFPRIAKAYLIGQAAEAFAATLAGRVATERSGTLAAALAAATRDATAAPAGEPVVLLSPACASYDQFKSFEHRGDLFRDLVRRIERVEACRSGG
jgi:UDP-N-acetylmuramoylalanine--D-glutamate ligase